MQKGQTTFVNQSEGLFKHGICFGRKACNQISAEDHVRTFLPQAQAKSDRVFTQVTALHAFENHIVARLKRQMQMRHDPMILGNGINQVFISLDRVNRGQSEAR